MRTTERILTHLDALPDKIRILEIGCGRGELFESINDSHEVEYFGVESNRNLYNLNLAKFNHLPNYHIYRGFPAYRTMWSTFANKELFDVIVIRGTFDALDDYDVISTVDYARFFLKSSGFFIVTKKLFNFRWLVKHFERTLGSCTVEFIPLTNVLLVAGK